MLSADALYHAWYLHTQAFHDAGWTRQEVINIPNALSMGRLLSGPVVAHLILQHHWPAAMITLAVAGVSDWADGYAAKHWGQSSVLGSYLDPLADKVLVGCTVGALAAEVNIALRLFCAWRYTHGLKSSPPQLWVHR